MQSFSLAIPMAFPNSIQSKFRRFLSTGATSFCAALIASTLSLVPVQAEAPTIDPSEDLSLLGAPENMLFWSPEQKVAGFRNIDKIFWTRSVQAGNDVFPLPLNLTDLSSVQARHNKADISLDVFVKQAHIAGMLVLKNGEIAYERYALGNTQDSKWMSFSVTKSIVSLLIGAAIKDGYIESLDEPIINYLPRLKGTSYDQASIRHVMQMSSGVAWDENYADPNSDINNMPFDPRELFKFLGDKPVNAKPGERFNYNTAETNLVGALLRSAIGNNLSTYLSTTIWQPFGMQADAVWMLSSNGGGEAGGCCLSATLRDYARLGLFAMNDGKLPDGSAALPDGWMKQSTTPSNAFSGYGYLWWLQEDGAYHADGIFGQTIYVNPAEQLVIAIQSARDDADHDNDWDLQWAMIEALETALRR